MTDLAAWLLDRIAEDVSYAEHAKWAMQGEWFTTADDKVDEFVRHMAPARVLAECAAKRAIVELHKPTATGWNEGDGEPLRYCTRCHHAWPCADLRLLAAVYADRDGHDSAWAVE